MTGDDLANVLNSYGSGMSLLLLDVSIKALLVLAALGLFALAFRRKSAAVRHLAGVMAALGLILLPVLTLALPQLSPPILSLRVTPTPLSTAAPAVDGGRSENQRAEAGDSSAPIEEPSLMPTAARPADPVSEATDVAAPSSPTAREAPPRDAHTPLGWPAWLCLAWIIGAGAVLGRRLVSASTVWWTARQSRRIIEEPWLHLLEELRRKLGLRRRIVLLHSDRLAVPLTCGTLRPVIFIPAKTEAWQEDRRRLLLMHELGHVKRWDCLTQLIAQLACAIHWFNPLVWLMTRWVRIQREHACDDLVLRSGAKASDYADALLETARWLQTSALTRSAALAMARRSRLEGRMAAILDPRRDRRSLTRMGIATALAVLLCAALPLGMVRATGPGEALAGEHRSPGAEPRDQSVSVQQRLDPESKQLALLVQKVAPGKPLGKLAETTLSGNVKAWTIVFCDTHWRMKSVPQQAVAATLRAERDAMNLPEQERLKVMDRIDDHVQVWLIRAPAGGMTGADLKSKIRPNPQPHQFHRELAYLGEGYGFAWFMHAPIWQWTAAQDQLKLREGDDRLAAFVRGAAVDDRYTCTRNTCLDMLGRAGPEAIPYIEKGIRDKHPQRYSVVFHLYQSRAPSVTEWLLHQLDSTDDMVARGARDCLLRSPRSEAADLYVRWLEQQAGKNEVYSLLKACKAVNAAGLERTLPRVLNSPLSMREYRAAFELQRALGGDPIAAELLDAEREIRTFGQKRQERHEQTKLDQAVEVILQSDDHHGAAMIAVCLAIMTTKAPEDAQVTSEVGLRILRQLPEERGKKLAAHLAHSCSRFTHEQRRLKEVAAALGATP